MKNITVTVSGQAYRQARVWAAARDTSLSRIVQYLIATLPNISRAASAFPEPKTDSNQPESAPSGANSTGKGAF
jgi:hypothetical protein